jgi:phage-related protein
MKIKFFNNRNETLDLSSITTAYLVKYDDVDKDISFVPVYGTDRINVLGKDTIKQRQIELNISLVAMNDYDFRVVVNDIYSFFTADRCYILDEHNNIYAEVKLKSIKKFFSLTGNEYRYTELKLILVALDGMFFDYNPIIITQSYVNTHSFNAPTINIPQFDTYPIIKIKSLVNRFNFIKIIGEGQILEIDTSGYNLGDILVIDGMESKIYLEKNNNQVDISTQVVRGGFIRLKKGANNLNFYFNIASNFNLTIEYRNRYII